MNKPTFFNFRILPLALFLYTAATFVIPHTSHAQLDLQDNDSLDISIEFDYNQSIVSLDLDQNTFIKTSIDGFEIIDNPMIQNPDNPNNPADIVPTIDLADRTVKLIGTAQLTWQPRGIYEIIIYTDNITELGFTSNLPGSGTTEQKANAVDRLTGLYPLYLQDPNDLNNAPALAQGFLFFKVWTQATAGLNQTTAPHTNGNISSVDYFGAFLLAQEQGRTFLSRSDFPDESFFNFFKQELDSGPNNDPNLVRFEIEDFARTDVRALNILTQDELDHIEASFGIVPERLAVNRSMPGSSFGSFRKIIASTRFFLKEYKIELSFATDLSDPILLINHNDPGIPEDKYIGKIYIDMLGN